MSCHPVRPDDNDHHDSVDTMGNREEKVEREDSLEASNVESIESRGQESQEENYGLDAQEELFCRMCDPIDEEIDEEAEQEAEVQRPFRDPGMPSRNEILEHNLTHIPPRPWCPHCVRGKGKDSPSLRLTGQYAESLVPRIRLDYCFLTESAEGDGDGAA